MEALKSNKGEDKAYNPLSSTFVKYHLERLLDSNQATVKRLLRSTYVDDVKSGAASDQDAFELYTQAKGDLPSRRFQPQEVSVQ